MDIWLTYAYILDGVVKNIACYLYTGYTEANVNAVSLYGNTACAVDVTHIPVQIGDTYSDGKFYHNGTEVVAIPSVSQQTSTNTASIADLNEAVDDIIIEILGG